MMGFDLDKGAFSGSAHHGALLVVRKARLFVRSGMVGCPLRGRAKN